MTEEVKTNLKKTLNSYNYLLRLIIIYIADFILYLKPNSSLSLFDYLNLSIRNINPLSFTYTNYYNHYVFEFNFIKFGINIFFIILFYKTIIRRLNSVKLEKIGKLKEDKLLIFLLFISVIPYINLILLITLLFLKTEKENTNKSDEFKDKAIYISFITSVISMIILSFEIYFIRNPYTLALFICLPIIIGLLPTLMFPSDYLLSKSESLHLTNLTLMFVLFFLIILAFEGLICILMSAPLALVVSYLFALIANVLKTNLFNRKINNILIFFTILLSPIFMGFQELSQIPPQIKNLKSEVIINSPVEIVWKEFLNFHDIIPPEEFYFHLGLSYPVSGNISGRGVNSLIRWQFTTGESEQIVTDWKENELIAFDVIKNPPTMKEMSFYDIHPPHLESEYLSAKNGYFKFEKVNNKQTKLIGFTTYRIDIWPISYWGVYTNFLHKKLQEKYLNNIKFYSEKTYIQSFLPYNPVAHPIKKEQ